MKMSQSSDSDDTPRSCGLTSFCRKGKITLTNERFFMAIPLITFGSALAEFVVIFSITGFMAIDVIAVSSICFSLLLSLATLLFIRFDRLTILAFLMLSVSLLSSSTFLIICFEGQRQGQVNRSTNQAQESPSSSSEYESHQHSYGYPEVSTGDNFGGSLEGYHYSHINGSRYGNKLMDLMRVGTELRWLHQLQVAERCCGFWNFTDWIEENSLLESNKSFKYHSEPIHPPTKWMVSCCDRNLTHDHSNCRAETIYDDWHDIVQYLFQEGCGSKLDDKLDLVQHELLKTALGLTLWDVLIAVDLVVYTIWRKLRSKTHTSCNGRGGTVATDDDDVFT